MLYNLFCEETFPNIQSKPNPVQLEAISPHFYPPLKGQTCVVHYTGKCGLCSVLFPLLPLHAFTM
uniref:Uncharacterized protein n=1 Tax=Serinus canaria TaxID=9135 RepID=A0A8C9NLL4_SERCA